MKSNWAVTHIGRSPDEDKALRRIAAGSVVANSPMFVQSSDFELKPHRIGHARSERIALT